MRIKITIGTLTVFAELNDSRTARLIWDNLTLEARAELWGDEVYFYIKPKIGIEKDYGRDVVEAGDVAYWPGGRGLVSSCQSPCMCLFFGLTPKSKNGKIMPASTVNVFGKLEGNPRTLSQVKENQPITVERA
ncbi:MAG: cyclophilin-like fold protein [Candidatus Omnitrophica bacterium]|nr:cyclophilin-like fold protein [Candidatus Omnitrophota bacterium]